MVKYQTIKENSGKYEEIDKNKHIFKRCQDIQHEVKNGRSTIPKITEIRNRYNVILEISSEKEKSCASRHEDYYQTPK